MHFSCFVRDSNDGDARSIREERVLVERRRQRGARKAGTASKPSKEDYEKNGAQSARDGQDSAVALLTASIT